ncbi:uncharacterized protein LOC110841444 [Zootermopsis nevadensis]|uniref:SAM domain-containing protein n=1 Tax=Zootermopsis nevadensis TaxID=136037 RepID=A0A067RIL3_ZOONE|nr:uncharacterized protein LOC110841444 [Zootermopsis nevadensis]KDR22878.1 hypothetical protein L798_14731 [Zootermopsis nevadensis]
MEQESERTSLVTLLSGLNLDEEEIQRFKQENIGLETFVLLSEYDLIEIGIKDRAKREAIMKVVCNLRSGGTKQKQDVTRLGPLSWKDGLTIVANSSQHLELLYGVVKYVRSQQRTHGRRSPVVVGFLDKKWSCSMALLACAAMAASQAECACKEMERLKLRVAGTTVDQKVGQHGNTTRLVSVFLASIVIVSFMLWKTNSLPVHVSVFRL